MLELFNWLGEKLGISEIKERLNNLENRVSVVETKITALEGEVGRGLENFGNYKNRTKEELDLMRRNIETILDTVNNVIDTLESEEAKNRAIALRKRLKNNQTRINNYLKNVAF